MYFSRLSIEKKPLNRGFSGYFYFAGANIRYFGAKSKCPLAFVYIWAGMFVWPIDAKREMP